MRIPEHLAGTVALLPDAPGVYVFRDANGEALYVGKAVSLKKRVRSHFQKPADERIRLMLTKAQTIEHYVVADENEALVLEYNLIKSLKPRYNVQYRDDKSYPFLAVTVGEPWPRLFLTRKLDDPRARYFGPYASALSARRTLEALRTLFPLRDCRGQKLEKHGRKPCLSYDIKRCAGPCIGAVDAETYRGWVREIVRFLEGKNEKLLEKLESDMAAAAAALRFEEAAAIRDRLLAARYILSNQRVVVDKRTDLDVYGYFSAQGEVYVKVLFVRNGRVIGSRGFLFETGNPVEAIVEAISLMRARGESAVHDVALPVSLSSAHGENAEILATVRAHVPRRGWRKDVLDLAMDNARQSYYWFRFQAKGQYEQTARLLEETRDILGLSRLPLRIECYDLSTFRGRNAVGSMVVFLDGKPKKSHYRKFRIRGRGDSDVDMMREIITRRLENLGDISDRSFATRPDLIIVDGGRPQLSAALDAIASAGLSGEIDVAALAKREEEIWLPGADAPVRLPPHSEVLKLFMRIRDESHRFAITYHRALELREADASVLDDIAGIGAARKKALLQQFGDVRAIARARVEDLARVVPRPVAERIRAELAERFRPTSARKDR